MTWLTEKKACLSTWFLTASAGLRDRLCELWGSSCSYTSPISWVHSRNLTPMIQVETWRGVFYSWIHLYHCLCVRDDHLTALGQCHWEGAEPGPALEGAAPSAHQQHRVRHGGLPAVDTGILHHRAQTRGERKKISTVVSLRSSYIFCSRSQTTASWRPCTEITATWKPSSAS